MKWIIAACLQKTFQSLLFLNFYDHRIPFFLRSLFTRNPDIAVDFSRNFHLATTPCCSHWGGLDHSQGKWFAPGEALPPGFIITAHPEGHTAPQEGHMMSDKARLRGQGRVVIWVLEVMGCSSLGYHRYHRWIKSQNIRRVGWAAWIFGLDLGGNHMGNAY